MGGSRARCMLGTAAVLPGGQPEGAWAPAAPLAVMEVTLQAFHKL